MVCSLEADLSVPWEPHLGLQLVSQAEPQLIMVRILDAVPQIEAQGKHK